MDHMSILNKFFSVGEICMQNKPIKKYFLTTFAILTLVMASVSLSACSGQQSVDTTEKVPDNNATDKAEDTELKDVMSEYLSITETFEDMSGMIQSNVKCLNIDSANVNDVQISTVEYSSQYPLTIYDRKQNVVYYSERVYVSDDDYGDQLFVYDLSTKESRQLTDNLYAVNYIFPEKDYVYMLGAVKNTHYLTIMRYDLKTNTLIVFDETGEWSFDLFVYDVYNGRFYASACNTEEEYNCRERYNSRPEEEYDDKFTPASYIVFEFGDDFYNPKEIFHTESKYVRRIAPTPDGKLFITIADTIPVMDPNYESYYLDISTGELSDAPAIDDATYVTEYVYFFPNDDKIYFIGVDPETDKMVLCSYNQQNNGIEVVYKPSNAHINNCFMLK